MRRPIVKSDAELFAAIVAIVQAADEERETNATENDDDDSTAVDIDYDAYQDIHRLLREDGRIDG